MDKNADLLRLEQLRKQAEHASKSPFVPDVDRVGWIFHAYRENATLLLHHIQEPHPDLAIALETQVPGSNPEIFRRYQSVLYRFLLNYCATTAALIDYARILKNKLEVTNKETWEELDRRTRLVSDTGLAHFIKDLRNYILHSELPSTGGNTSWEASDGKIRFDTILYASSLLESRKWDAKSKWFLQENEHVSMATAIVDYDKLLQTLYEWVFEEVSRVAGENAQRMVDLDSAITCLEHKLGLQSDHIEYF